MRKALVDGLLVNLMDDGDQLWTFLRREAPPIVCVGCGGKAHTRELNFGLLTVRTFAHNPGFGERCRLLGDVGESAEHEVLKEAIVKTARSSGWQADIEVISPDEKVRADVVCSRNGRTHSWEAQLASLNRRLANERHEKYVHTWGNTTWVHTRSRDWSKDIPCVRVDDDTQETVVGGIYADDGGEVPVPPTPLVAYVPRILNNDGIQYLLEPFGFYRDLGATPHTRRRSGLRRRSLREGIYYSDTDCPSDEGDDDLPRFGFDCVEMPNTAPPAPADLLEGKTEEWWIGRARMARARQATGGRLDGTDRKALEHWSDRD
jgi:hypothetical protein